MGDLAELVVALGLLLMAAWWLLYLPLYHFVFVLPVRSQLNQASHFVWRVRLAIFLQLVLFAAVVAFRFIRPEMGWRRDIVGYVGATVFISAAYSSVVLNCLLMLFLRKAIVEPVSTGLSQRIRRILPSFLIVCGGVTAAFAVRAEAAAGPLSYDLRFLWLLLLIMFGSVWLLYREARDVSASGSAAMRLARLKDQLTYTAFVLTVAWLLGFAGIPTF